MLLHRFARQLPAFRVTPETSGLIVLGLAMVGSVPFSVWPGGALEVFLDQYLKVLVVFVLMMNTLTTPKRLNQISWLIVVCCGYVAALGLFDWARGVNLVENGRLAGPVGGICGNPNDLAMNMVTFLPAAIVVAVSTRYPATKRAVAAGVAGLMLATILLTQSRGGAMGLVAVVAMLVALGRVVRRGFAVIAVVAVIAALPVAPSGFWDRMAAIVDPQQDTKFTGSREARRIVMQEGINAFVEHPLTGVGAGQFQNYNPPGRVERWRETHNALIQVAAETGIVGLLAFAYLIVRAAISTIAMRRALAPPRRRSGPDSLRLVMSDDDRQMLRGHSVAMAAGLAGWFVCSLFASVAYNWTFYYLLALIAAGRELTHHRLSVSRAMQKARTSALSVPGFWRRPARA
jgi:O-antigen ligase